MSFEGKIRIFNGEGGDVFLIEITLVLSQYEGGGIGSKALDSLDPLNHDVFSLITSGSVHSGERDHLEEVVLADVFEGAGLIVVTATLPNPKILGGGNLDMIEVLGSHQGLE